MDTISRRQKQWIGHTLRQDGLFKKVLEGKFKGRRPRGRMRTTMLQETRK